MDKYGIRNIADPYNFVEVQQAKKRAEKISGQSKKEKKPD